MVKQIKIAEIEEEIKYSGLTVIDFFATWCPPCKAIAPLYEKLDTEHEEAHFFKVDSDEARELLRTDYEIAGLPTFLFYIDGKLVDKVVGGYPDKLREAVIKNAAAATAAA